MNPLDLIGLISACIVGLCMLWMLAFAGHSLWMLLLFRRRQHAALAAERAEFARPLPADLPMVLVQLPVFNERDVAERVIRSAIALDWPKDRLVIQVLDDSTDDTVEICRRTVEDYRRQGFDIRHLHRTDRTGYKAGALQAALVDCDAPYIAIFDADFIPHPDFIQRAIRPFLADPTLAVVQGRWEHINPRGNCLTRAQAIGLDGHFAIEQAARAWNGLPMHFNGTCGMWRREAIDEAGGWQHDTITEDLDLSYRAQLAGYHCTYRMDLDVPGELPDDVDSWRNQQFRWAKGSTQVARKLLGRIWRSAWSLDHKLVATFHITHYSVNVAVMASLITAPLALWLCPHRPWYLLILSTLAIFSGLAASFATYIHSQKLLRGATWRTLVKDLPVLAALGTGLALSNSRAIIEALFKVVSPFIRTPKKGAGNGSYRASTHSGIPECLASLWALWGHIIGLNALTPILLVYVSGFAWVGVLSLRNWWTRTIKPACAPALDERPRRAWTTLALIAVVSLAGYLILATRPYGWQQTPLLFGLIGLGLGALYLMACFTARIWPHGRSTLVVILLAAIAFRVATLGWPSRPQPVVIDDVQHRVATVRTAAWGLEPDAPVARYIVEGSLIRSLQNPYRIRPGNEEALQNLAWRERQSARLFIEDQLRRGEGVWSTVDAPAGLAATMLGTGVSSHPWTFKFLACLAECLALALVMGMVLRRGLPPALIILVAWNPLGPLFFCGQGHIAAVAMLFLAIGLAWSDRGRTFGSAIGLTLAALVKPVTGLALLVKMPTWSKRMWLLPPILALAAWLPFATAGKGLLAGFAESTTGHGAIAPFLTALANALLEGDVPNALIPALLAAIFAAGSWLILWKSRRDGEDDHLLIIARLSALLLLCLPAWQPWQLVPLLLLLPFARSWGLLLWTASAPAWWLYAADPAHRLEQIDPLWIGLVLHVPALVWTAWEWLGTRQTATETARI